MLLTSRPASLPSRSGAMTPFSVNTVPPSTRKSTREPPFSTPPPPPGERRARRTPVVPAVGRGRRGGRAFCGRFAGPRPVILREPFFRERVGFQSNAQMGGTRSTGNLRARGESGASRRDPGMGETPGTGPGAEILPRLRSRAPGEVIGVGAGPGGVIQAGAGPAARPADTLPGRSEGADCQNLPQRPVSSRSAPEETLIFRASTHRQSRRGAPLWQIRTRPHPEPPQEPHPPHHDGAPRRRTPARGRRRPASGPSSLIIRVHRSEYRCPEPEYQAPGPGRRAAGEGSLRCRCRRHPASGSGGWSYRRRGRRR